MTNRIGCGFDIGVVRVLEGAFPLVAVGLVAASRVE